MARFFIHRPIFAWVIALVTMLVGGLGLLSLPIEQYPQIAPTSVRISASYTGASAEIVESSVTTVIEDAMTGIDGLVYMTSSSTPCSATISLTFDDSVDPDIAQVQVQNKLQLVTSQLPTVVQQNGVNVSRSTSSILLVGALASNDGRFSSLELGDMVAQMLEDPVKRTPGVGSINVFGSGYAMRVWLDPMKMAQNGLTAADVKSAITSQNIQAPVGSIGARPTENDQEFQYSARLQGRLKTEEEFGNQISI